MPTTIYTAGGKTYCIFRYRKGIYSVTTRLTPDEVRQAIKGVNLPTSRQRAAERQRRVKQIETLGAIADDLAKHV